VPPESKPPLELKSTLNLPRTDFSMKANLPHNEPKMLSHWQELGVYEQIRRVRSAAPVFVLHDGPPYANGPIHLGTAMNKCLKDFVVKSKSMAGYNAPYVPGWDCHGLPIEIKVDDMLGRKKLEMAPLQVRQACRKYAEKYLDLQREQFKRIGVLGQWEEPYLTMSPEYEAAVIEVFYAFFERGMVYKGLKPVYWCIHDRTALAEAEVEYENHTSPGIWVRYALTSDPARVDPALAGKPLATVIWTTTPWTLPASLAVAFHAEEEYVALEPGGLTPSAPVYLLAAKLAAANVEKIGLAGAREIARFPGSRLEHATFAHPFLPERAVLGVVADYVTMDQGTGAVHTAPSHGADDFYTGQKYGLDLTCNVDEGGHLLRGLPEYEGKSVFQANPLILDLLRRRGVLLHEEKIEHSYPHCWRCHNPVIFRATEQWFISLDALPGPAVRSAGGTEESHREDPAPTLRRRALEEIRKVKWDPAWGEERIANMIATRPDWCISRQRIWGVPIAVFFCESCGRVLNERAVNRAVTELFRREGADAWYARPAAEILPAGTKCPCGQAQFRKEMDIIDVWFESGSSHAAVLGRQADLPWPADLYLEGGDQHRGWFHSSLLCAVGWRDQAPYRAVATHGWTLDAQGRPQSKSLGNVVDPVDVAARLGAEVVRLWAASVDFREDVHGSEELMLRIAESYRKVRNTFRYILGNLHGFHPARDMVPFQQMEPLDQYMLCQTWEMAAEVLQWYEEFAFHKVYQRVNQFCVVDLSAIYFDILKDRLYTFAARSAARRSGQSAIWLIGEVLVRLLAPIMSFTADEVWRHLPAVPGRAESVHLAEFPSVKEIAMAMAADRKSDWDALMAVRPEVLKALEEARQRKLIGSGLEAKVRIIAAEPLYTVLQRNSDHLCALFIVSQVELHPAQPEGSPAVNGAAAPSGAPFRVQVSKADGRKCERCWNYSERVGEDPRYPTVCERCSVALKEIEAERMTSVGE
jgi:isoleucyl-tRNA synthetase